MRLIRWLLGERRGMQAGNYQPTSMRAISNIPARWEIIVPADAVDLPDVSFYQGVIDFDKMAANTNEIVIRMGQGNWNDTQWERNYTEARARGMKVGAYWFFDGRQSATTQANLIKSLMAGKYLDMELFIDWELNYGGRYEGLGEVVSLMQAVESVADVGLYTGYYYFIENSNAISNAAHYNYLKDKPLWIAWYTSNPANVKIPAPWTTYTYWQYGTPAVGKQYGCATIELDKNKFNGNAAAFVARYGGTLPPPPTGDPMNGLAKEKLGKYPSVRSSPTVASNKLYSLNPYSEVEFVEFVKDSVNGADDWLKLVDGNFVNLDVAGTRYFLITRMPTVEPPVSLPPLLSAQFIASDGQEWQIDNIEMTKVIK